MPSAFYLAVAAPLALASVGLLAGALGYKLGDGAARDQGFAEGRGEGFAEGRDLGYSEGHSDGLRIGLARAAMKAQALADALIDAAPGEATL